MERGGFRQSGTGCLQLRLRLRLVPVIEVRLRWGPFPQRSMVKDWARLRLILSPGSRKRPRAEPFGLAGAPSPALDGERSGKVLLGLSGGRHLLKNRRAGRRCEPSAVGKAPPSGTATVAERPNEGQSGKLRGARRLLRQESGRCHKPTTEPCVSARMHGEDVDGSSIRHGNGRSVSGKTASPKPEQGRAGHADESQCARRHRRDPIPNMVTYSNHKTLG